MVKLQTLLGAVLLVLMRTVAADATGVVAPVGSGAYAVACSNIAQDFTLAGNDASRAAYWEGDQGRYVTELLSEPQDALVFDVPVPNDSGLFPSLAGRQIRHAALVCYPTSEDNFRPDYPYDTGYTRFVPKMQRNSESPLWADAAARYPLILYSHGLGGSPLSDAYLETITKFASHGYVVAMPFHGDPRFADVYYDGLDDFVRLVLLGGYADLVEMQAIRPLSLRVLLDRLLSHPDFGAHIDPDRIAGFGTSLGGESLLLFAGAELTDRVFPSLRSRQVMRDARLAAAVGYVPYFGQGLLPAFGDDQRGLDGMSMPFMAISGTADTTAPIDMTRQGVDRMAGSRYLVAFDGLPHLLRVEDLPDIFTWTLAFFDAHLDRNFSARDQLAGMTAVSGGANDSVLVSYTAPIAPNFQGIWWNPDEPGWGMSVAQQGPIMFVGWYTYDESGASTRYFMSNCAMSGTGCSGDIYRVSGGASPTMPWNGYDSVTTVGRGTLTFADPDSGVFDFVLNGVAGSKNISRFVFGSAITPPAVDYTSLWWNPDESGWGVFLSHQASIIFAALYTYDDFGNPVRYVTSNCAVSGNGCSGILYRTSGGSAPTAPWAGPVTLTPIGTISFSFTDSSHASMSFTIDGVPGSKTITKMIFHTGPG